MITLKLNDDSYSLPEKWEEVTLGLFQKISKIDTSDKLRYSIQLIQALTGLEEKTIININKNQFKEIIETINFIYTTNINEEFANSFVIGMDEYVLKDFNSLTMGEAVSLETLIEKGDNLGNAHYLLAILFKKNNEEEFNFDDLEYRALEIQNNISMQIVNKILLFFFDYVRIYIENLKGFSEHKKKMKQTKMMKNQKGLTRLKNYLKNFFGYHWSRGSQWVTSPNIKKFTKKTSSIA